jgi:hypothetical protein
MENYEFKKGDYFDENLEEVFDFIKKSKLKVEYFLADKTSFKEIGDKDFISGYIVYNLGKWNIYTKKYCISYNLLKNKLNIKDFIELNPQNIEKGVGLKKGDCVVLVSSCNGKNAWKDSLPENYCFKIRTELDKIYSCGFHPELDIKDSRDNGWFLTETAKRSNLNLYENFKLRLATQEEIDEYNRLGKPFDVSTLLKTEEESDYVVQSPPEGVEIVKLRVIKDIPKKWNNWVSCPYIPKGTITWTTKKDFDNTISRYYHIEGNRHTTNFSKDFFEVVKDEFIAGKWYKYTADHLTRVYYAKYSSKQGASDQFWYDEIIINGVYELGRYWSVIKVKPILLEDLSEIQEFLPDNHPDKVSSNNIKKLSKEELLAEAQRRYPIGTKFKCTYDKKVYTVYSYSNVIKNGWVYENDLVVQVEEKTGIGRYLYFQGKWAEKLGEVNSVEYYVREWPSGTLTMGCKNVSEGMEYFKSLENYYNEGGVRINECYGYLKNNYSDKPQRKATKEEIDYFLNHGTLTTFKSKNVVEEKWTPKVGDWVYTNCHNIEDYKEGCYKVIGVDFNYLIQPCVLVQYDKNESWCYPTKEHHILRKAKPHEIPEKRKSENAYNPFAFIDPTVYINGVDPVTGFLEPLKKEYMRAYYPVSIDECFKPKKKDKIGELKSLELPKLKKLK